MSRQLVTAALGLAMLLVPLQALAQDDCTADIRGTLERKDEDENFTDYSVKLEVSAMMSCAVVRFDVVVVEQGEDGRKFKVRLSRKVRIRDSRTATQKLNYRLRKGQSVIDHSFEQTSCEVCD